MSGSQQPDRPEVTNGTAPPGPSPSTARRRLGQELRAARESAGLLLANAASGIQRSAATLSRLETGKSMPRLVDVRALLDHYATVRADSVPEAARARILSLAESSREAEWFTSFRDVISGDMTSDDIQSYVEFETVAKVIRAYEPALVPGLLQTRPYAEAVTEVIFPGHPLEAHRRFVDFRMARQRVLSRPGGSSLTFDVVLGETVLRRKIGTVDVMREQLTALLKHITDGRPNVSIRIVPASASSRAVFGGPFAVMDLPDDGPGLVYLEGREGSQFLQTTEAVARYSTLFTELAGAVLDKDASVRLLEEVLLDIG